MAKRKTSQKAKPMGFTAAEVEKFVAPMRSRIAALESELAAARSK